MTVQIGAHAPQRRVAPARTSRIKQPLNCPIATCSAISRYEHVLEKHRRTEAKLRKSVAREHALLCQKDELIRQKDVLSKESEHRLLNGLQMITSLLSIQSRAAKSSEAAEQLTVAANRVAAIGRVHRHLHALDHVANVEFKEYLKSLCLDLAGMASNGKSERDLVVQGIEVRLPSATAIPLGFIANELITNAIKYGSGRITVDLSATLNGHHVLSISDNGPGLPEGFDASATQGLGIKLISSLVKRIGGELYRSGGENGSGARFAVEFP